MAKQTLASISGKVGYQSRDGLGYRKTRATAVLAMHSAHVRNKQEPKLEKILGKLRDHNFDQNQLKPSELEYIFAHFDDEMSKAITAEFEFRPTFGSIRDLHRAEGHCDLCGKGDSRDDGGNEDKLRYQFLLTNTAGGESIWVGSSCILQHGLHVDGAANAEEAEVILRKTLQQHLKVWKIEAWKNEHPDHESIMTLWQAFRNIPYYRDYPDELYGVFGTDALTLLGRHRKAYRAFRTAARFYGKNGFLTESKTAVWLEAKALWAHVTELRDLFREALQKFPPKQDSQKWWVKRCDEAVAELERIRDEREAQNERERKAAAALRKAKRKPSRKAA